jgi:hypothetical protein
VTRLEAKVQEQETILNFLLKANDELPISSAGSKSIENYRQNVIQSNGRSGIPRTCRELRAANPSLASGMQFIDPDGQGIGDDPIYVYCDMSTGKFRHFHLFLFKIKLITASNRIDINFTRQRISHRRGSLHRSWMLFTRHQLQRVQQTNKIVGWIINRMSSVD